MKTSWLQIRDFPKKAYFMTISNSPTVIVGLSGGVDSSVAALLLKEQGYNVVGIFMRNWQDKDSEEQCSAEQDIQDVSYVCSKLDIPYHVVNFVEEYQDQVFQEFIEQLELGFTPNPDILCNKEIKFKAFYNEALKLGAEYIATGHYCQTNSGNLLRGLDTNKDQSYFLHAINPEVLNNVLFPIGALEKHQVREIAKQNDLITHNKKDSTGICFIGERKMQLFLKDYIKPKEGEFQLLDGTVVGKHMGAQFYTLGQRRHLGLGGEGSRWFVVQKDMEKNIIYVERNHDHPALFRSNIKAVKINWLTQPKTNQFNCTAKIRYRQADQACSVQIDDQGNAEVIFETPQRAVVAGQYIVFYDEAICLGGGMITEE